MTRQEEKDQFFMRTAIASAMLSTCLRRWVGAVLVRDNMILSTGYNGCPSHLKHCTETGCIRGQNNVLSGERIEFCRGIHAEQNALLQCLKKQTDPTGCILYTTTFPCVTCMKLLIQSGVKEIVFNSEYPDDLSKQIMREAGVNSRKLEVCTK